MEEIKVSGAKLKSTLKELLREGNVRRIILRNAAGRTLLDMPLSVGLVLILLGEVFLLSFTLTAMGLAVVARITQVQTVMGLMQVLVLPLSFLSGALYPLSNLPTWLSIAVRLNPLTYAVHPVRTAVFDRLTVPPADAKFAKALMLGISTLSTTNRFSRGLPPRTMMSLRKSLLPITTPGRPCT